MIVKILEIYFLENGPRYNPMCTNSIQYTWASIINRNSDTTKVSPKCIYTQLYMYIIKTFDLFEMALTLVLRFAVVNSVTCNNKL